MVAAESKACSARWTCSFAQTSANSCNVYFRTSNDADDIKRANESTFLKFPFLNSASKYRSSSVSGRGSATSRYQYLLYGIDPNPISSQSHCTLPVHHFVPKYRRLRVPRIRTKLEQSIRFA